MDYTEKAFAQASETSKLLITLSTALVAFCAAIVNVKVADVTLFSPSTTCQRILLAISWLALLGAAGTGVWTQLAITGVLNSGSGDPNDKHIKVPFQIQIIVFLAGIVLLVWYGLAKLFS